MVYIFVWNVYTNTYYIYTHIKENCLSKYGEHSMAHKYVEKWKYLNSKFNFRNVKI